MFSNMGVNAPRGSNEARAVPTGVSPFDCGANGLLRPPVLSLARAAGETAAECGKELPSRPAAVGRRRHAVHRGGQELKPVRGALARRLLVTQGPCELRQNIVIGFSVPV